MRKRLSSVILFTALASLGFWLYTAVFYREAYPVVISYNYPKSVVVVTTEQPPQDSGTEAAEPEQSHEETLELIAVQFPLELNGASYDELTAIPKVGRVTASRMLAYKEALGGYSALGQLMEIKGIGQKTYDEISRYLYIEDS